MPSPLLDPLTGFWVGPPTKPAKPVPTLLAIADRMPDASVEAIHELGHGLAAVAYGHPFKDLVVDESGGAMNPALSADSGDDPFTQERLIAHAVATVGGAWAELAYLYSDGTDAAPYLSDSDTRALDLIKQTYAERHPDATFPDVFALAAEVLARPEVMRCHMPAARLLHNTGRVTAWQLQKLVNEAKAAVEARVPFA